MRLIQILTCFIALFLLASLPSFAQVPVKPYQYKGDSTGLILDDYLDFEPKLYNLDDCFCPWLYNKDSVKARTKKNRNYSPYQYENTEKPIILDVPDSTLQKWKNLGLIKIYKRKEEESEQPVL